MHYPSYAKINLGLKVLGKRPDGYHDIETIYQQIDLADTLQITVAARDINVASTDFTIPVNEGNLCYRAAVALQQHTNGNPGARIYIEKVLPSCAGLGGGSSNAAATLLALNKLWKIRLSKQKLVDIASSIGSDVPFFILGGTAYALGRGEKLYPINLNLRYWGVLVYPNIEISSTWAYKSLNFNLTNSKKSVTLRNFINNEMPFSGWQDYLSNDFEDVVFEHYPILQQIKRKLIGMGAFFSSMTGTGSTIFGLFETPGLAVAASEVFDKNFKVFIFRPQQTG